MICSRCSSPCKPSAPGDILAGYATDRQGRKFCYECCAALDREAMIRDGSIGGLYLTSDAFGAKVTNFPGSLVFRIRGAVTKSRVYAFGHGIEQRSAHFDGPDGFIWSVISRGNMDLARCKRTKARVRSDDPLVDAAFATLRATLP